MTKKTKRIIAFATIAFGVCFTLLALLSIWGVFEPFYYEGTILGRLLPTLGILTLAGICLLAILKMIEDKTNNQQ